MIFFKNTRKYVKNSFGGLITDVKDMSSKISGETNIGKNDPKQICRNCLIASAIVLAMLIFKIFEKKTVEIVIFSLLFAGCMISSSAMLYQMYKNGDITKDGSVLSDKDMKQMEDYYEDHYNELLEKKEKERRRAAIKKEAKLEEQRNRRR